MAKTKFLDYTGLAKLVEKIKNTYVNIGGSTMTGTLKTLENQPAINFRPNNSGYSVTLNYDTESAEALAINLKNFATSFMINSGVDGTTWTGEGHQSKVTPTIHVRKNCVSINKYIADNITQEYKLDVNGDVKANSFTGKLNGNANTASKLGTATVGGATKPMYLSGGTPTECTYTLAQNVTSASKLTDTTYSASTGLSLSKDNKFSINAATSSTIGGVKIGSGITVDTGGTISLTKTNVTNALGYTPPTADTNTTYTFTSGTGGTFTVKASNSNSGQTVSVGVPAKASAATSAETAATAEKVGSETVGSATQPIYLSGGTPTKCTYTLAQNVTSTSKLTDTTYSASTGLSLSKDNKFSINAATSSTIGGVKIGSGITVDTGGTISLTKTNVTNALGYTPPTADTNTTYTFTSGTGGTFTVKASNSNSGQTVSVGVPAKASAATSAETAATAEKVGSETVGSATQPIYLSGGTPTKCTYTLAQSVTSTSKLTDHLYNAGEGLKLTTGTTADTFSLSAATSSTIGGVKIGNNISITSGTISLTKGNVVNALGYTPPTADTNTHYTTGLIVGNSSSSTGNTAVTTNGVFLNLKDDNNIRNSHKIVGGGATTVTSDSGGTITIHSTDKKVYQEVDTTSIGVTPLLLSPLSEDTKTGETYFTTSAKINFNIVAVPKSGTLKATHFIGTTFSGDTFSGTTFTGNAATATSAITATYAKKYSYNGMDSDFVYDVVDGGNHYIRCKDAKILRANGTNLNNYEFIINADGKGGCYIYDSANAKGTTWGPDGIVFDKAPANSLVAANGTFATAISDTDIKNAINSAIDWTQAP